LEDRAGANLKSGGSRSCRECADRNTRKYYPTHDFFEILDSEKKCYILGLLMSDGCVHNNSIKIELSSKDYNTVELVRDSLSPESPIYLRKGGIDKRKGYISRICTPDGRIYLGSFKNVIDAAIAYDNMAKKIGKIKSINFKE